MQSLAVRLALGVALAFGITASVSAAEYLLADGQAWPGQIFQWQGGAESTAYLRPLAVGDDVPRIQSLTRLADGRLVFASGLDRSVFEVDGGRERRLHHGGYLVRQVRSDADGALYWSGLETPRDGNPLPDGFIYRWRPETNQTETLLTFSQGDVGRDWWGAFDVRDGQIYVGTLRGRTRIYDVSASPVRQVCELPIAATAFRFGPGDSLYACDGQGVLYRFDDLSRPDDFQEVLRSTRPFADFVVEAGFGR
jgi:hypothetical protein